MFRNNDGEEDIDYYKIKENSPLLKGNDISINYKSSDDQNAGQVTEFRVYKRRWWVLFMFMMLSLNQCNFWITFSTVAELAAQYYRRDLAQINFLSSLGPILFVPFSVVFSWSINRYGIRKNILVAAALVAVGGGIRSLPFEKFNFSMVIVGQSLNAIAGPFMMTVPTKISNVWFGPQERTLATAISTVANFSGSAIGFLLALLATNVKHLQYLLYGEAAGALVIFICILIYFPEKPPTPPSATALDSQVHEKQEHAGLIESWKLLFKQSYQFLSIPSALILTIVVSITSGFYAGWSAVLTEIIIGTFTPAEGKWLGFYGILAGLFGGIACGFLHDKVHNFKKLIIIILFFNTVTYLLFSLIIQGILPSYYWLGQVFNILGGFLINGYYPIIYEAAVEVTYPIPESVGSALISILINIFTFVSIEIGSFIPPQSLNWILVGCSGVSCILLLGVKQEYKRSQTDTQKQSEIN